MKRKELVAFLGAALVAGLLVRGAWGLLYLPANSLESLLVRAEVTAIGTVKSVDAGKDEGTVEVRDCFVGKAEGVVKVSRVSVQVGSKESRVRFAEGDRVLIFLTGENKGTRAVLHADVLKTEADEKTMKGCVTEVLPFAGVLAELANRKKEVEEKKILGAVEKLGASRNGFTQVLMGRLMGTEMAGRVKPELCEGTIVAAMKDGRTELKEGAMTWAMKFERLPTTVKTEAEGIAEGKDKGLAKKAKALLAKYAT